MRIGKERMEKRRRERRERNEGRKEKKGKNGGQLVGRMKKNGGKDERNERKREEK